MQILIGCAKDMETAPKVKVPFLSEPLFIKEAENNAEQMAVYSADDLSGMLGVSLRLAGETYGRYKAFFDCDNRPQAAITAYNGVVFKNIGIDSFSDEDFDFAQRHLWITSFLYGLLRPLDGIRPYRLEGKIELPDNGGTMFAFWRRLLTDVLVDSVRNDGGVLVDLASAEMRQLFDWNEVEKSVTVIKPHFYVEKNGRLTMPSVNAKKCRGAMTSWLIRNRISDANNLPDFTCNGLTYHGGVNPGSGNNPMYLWHKLIRLAADRLDTTDDIIFRTVSDG